VFVFSCMLKSRVWLLALAMPLADAHAADFQTLYGFRAGSDGAVPEAELIADGDGNLYGTTSDGGKCRQAGCGTIFKLAPDGTETVLYTFCSQPDCSDGLAPVAGLIEDAGGNFYGTTAFGGAARCGAVFELAANGGEKVLYSFKGGRDGCNPESTLLADSSGNFYGTTLGYYDPQGGDYGTVYKLAPGAAETVIYAFRGGDDGCEPSSGLVADSAGNLYGTAPGCGASGYGTIFEISGNGTETTVHTFTGGADGAVPIAGLIADAADNFYGTTYEGGGAGLGQCTIGCGTIFKLAPDGSVTILHAFAGGRRDGALPLAALAADADGDFFGTTALGGGKGVCKFDSRGDCGTVFKLAPDNTLSILHAFSGGSDGGIPGCRLLLRKHHLYGTAQQGGNMAHAYKYGAGTVFEQGK